MDSIYNEIIEQAEPEIRDLEGPIVKIDSSHVTILDPLSYTKDDFQNVGGSIVKIDPSHATVLNPLFYTEDDLCGNKECEPPFGGKEDCEFCYNGFCTANKPSKTPRSHNLSTIKSSTSGSGKPYWARWQMAKALNEVETSVLISIRPQWCARISSGQKTLEIRKNKPSLPYPFKCYVYCTKGNPNDPHQLLEIHDSEGKIHRGNGHVIGEFICDDIFPIHVFDDGLIQDWNWAQLEDACVPYEEMADYIGKNKVGYAWHISNFVLYEKPQDIDALWEADRCPYVTTDRCSYPYHCFRTGESKRCGAPLSRVPQSWCYTSGFLKTKDVRYRLESIETEGKT